VSLVVKTIETELILRSCYSLSWSRNHSNFLELKVYFSVQRSYHFPEASESRSQSYVVINLHFNITFACIWRPLKWPLPFKLTDQNVACMSHLTSSVTSPTALMNLGPAEQPPLAVFPDCTRRYWVDMWSAHRIPQLHLLYSSNYSVYLITRLSGPRSRPNSLRKILRSARESNLGPLCL
jgi:hypothetical protein